MDTIKLALGDREFDAPPLNIATLKRFREHLKQLRAGELPQEEAFVVMSAVVYETLRRANPALTQEEVDEVLDIQNIESAFIAIGRLSVPPGEPKAESL